MPLTIEDWVANKCQDVQGPLDTAESAIKAGNVTEQWSCPKCPVKIGVRRRTLFGYGMRLIEPEKCANLPPLDQPLE